VPVYTPPSWSFHPPFTSKPLQPTACGATQTSGKNLCDPDPASTHSFVVFAQLQPRALPCQLSAVSLTSAPGAASPSGIPSARSSATGLIVGLPSNNSHRTPPRSHGLLPAGPVVLLARPRPTGFVGAAAAAVALRYGTVLKTNTTSRT
jgi:hypothetical protein